MPVESGYCTFTDNCDSHFSTVIAVYRSHGDALLLLQISSTSTSVVLSDPSIYANLFRTVPSDEPLAPALVTLMQYFGWKQMSVVTEKEPRFMEVFNSTIWLLYYSNNTMLIYSFSGLWKGLFLEQTS